MEMRFTEIKPRLEEIKIFSLNDLYLIDEGFRQPTLYEWESKGLVKKVRRGWYILGSYEPRNTEVYLVSNKIYKPSYVSLEMALSHYAIIPEAVTTVTAISTKKTRSFSTFLGLFDYKTISKNLFFGYTYLDFGVQFATLEKTILDFLYYKKIYGMDDFKEFRFNKDVLNSSLDLEKFDEYAMYFDSVTLVRKVNVFKNFLKYD